MQYLAPTLRLREDKNGKPWQAVLRYRDDDSKPWKQVSKYIHARNQTEAKKAMNEWSDEVKREHAEKEQQALQKQEQNSAINLSVADFVDQYITNYEAIQAVERSTIRGYRTTALYIREFFSNVALKELTALQVQDFETALIQRGLSSSTVGKCQRLLKQVLKHAKNIKVLKENVADMVKPPKRQSTQPNALDAESRRKVAEYIANHEASATVTGIALALFAGLHSAECCGLTWANVDLDNAQIRVSESIGLAEGGMYIKSPKNESRRRTIDIPPQLVEVLKRRKQAMQAQAAKSEIPFDSKFYVLSYDLWHYMNPNNLSKAWKVISESIGVNGTHNNSVRFHDLRHTYATVAVAAGIDVKTVASMLGHSNEYVTLHVYASPDPNAKKAAAAKIGEVYEKQTQVIPFKRAGNE